MLYIAVLLLVLAFSGLVRLRQMPFCLHDFSLEETLPLRGILAICVMLCHLCPYWVEEAPLLSDFGLWGPPSVSTFFMLTGYGLGISYMTRGDEYLSLFLRKRFLKLIGPFLMVVIIYQVYKIFNGTFSCFSLLIEPSPMSWFIYALIIWYLFFFFSFRIGRRNRQRIGLLWLFAIVYIAITFYYGLSYYYLSILPLPSAVTYVFWEKKIKEYILRFPYRFWIISYLLFLLFAIYGILGQFGYQVPLWGPLVYNSLPWAMLFATYYLGGWKCHFWNFMGSISYEFYLLHGFIILLFGSTRWFGLEGYGNAGISIIFITILTICCARIIRR